MAKPISMSYTFGTQPGPVPLSYLDINYATITAAINDTLTYNNYVIDTGGANSYAVAFGGSITTSYTAGLLFVFKAANANTGASTINVNSLGAKNILNQDGSALSAGQIIANSLVMLCYDGTSFLLMNDPSGEGTIAGNVTITGNLTVNGTTTLALVGGGAF